MLGNTQLESPLLGRRQHRHCQRLPAGWGNQAKSWQRCLIPGRHTDTTAQLGREQPKMRSMCSNKAIEKDLPLLGRRQHRHCQRLPAGWGNQAKSWQRCLIPGRHTDTTAQLGREQPKMRSMCSNKAIEKDLPLLGRRQHRHCQRLPAGWGNQAKSWQRCLRGCACTSTATHHRPKATQAHLKKRTDR